MSVCLMASVSLDPTQADVMSLACAAVSLATSTGDAVQFGLFDAFLGPLLALIDERVHLFRPVPSREKRAFFVRKEGQC